MDCQILYSAWHKYMPTLFLLSFLYLLPFLEHLLPTFYKSVINNSQIIIQFLNLQSVIIPNSQFATRYSSLLFDFMIF